MSLHLPDFSGARVTVVGDLMLDRYWSGGTGRISPEAPVPVVNIAEQEDRPGGAANVAMNLATLGAKVTLIGRSGDDESADTLTRQLSGLGVECDFVRDPEVDTITKLRIMSRSQQLIRLDFEQLMYQQDAGALIAKATAALSHTDVLVLSDYAKGTLNCTQALIEAANKAGVKVVVDPKGSSFEKYAGAFLLTPNMSEFETIVGAIETEAELVEKGHQLRRDLQLDALLITRSEKGMTLLREGEDELHLPAQAKEVYDVTGAGDTVISTLAASIAAQSTLDGACALANMAASIVVGKLGTSCVSVNELKSGLQIHSQFDTGVMSQEQLQYAVAMAKSRGETVVMTNGCFDILHAGHVAYLEQAAALGDRLIVAVNEDASVTRLKGDGRPVNPAERRMAVLAGLGAVDWVVPFGEDTPRDLIASVLPDLLVKGGDYKPEEIAGAKEVWDNGGEVKVLNFEDGVSTTSIINRIKLQD